MVFCFGFFFFLLLSFFTMMQVIWFGPLKMMKVKLCNSNFSNLHARYFPPLIVYLCLFH